MERDAVQAHEVKFYSTYTEQLQEKFRSGYLVPHNLGRYIQNTSGG